MKKVFLDCGAWVGNSIPRFRELYPDNSEYTIYSFEPHPESAKRFRINQPKIKLIEAGIWTSNGERTLRTGDGKWIEGSTLVKQKRVKRYKKASNLKVKCIDFAEWIKNNLSKEDYIVCKLNIEGAEYKIIKHLHENNLLDWFDEWWIEFHWGKMEMTEDQHQEVVNLLPRPYKQWELDHQRKAIYTVITSNKYSLNEPLRFTEDWDYICFSTNKELTSEGWEIRYIEPGSIDPRKLSRKIKILHDHYLTGYNLSVYIDTRFTVKCNLNKFVEERLTNDIAVMEHNKRNCVFVEAKHLLDSDRLSKEDKAAISNQIRKYKNFCEYGR